MGWRRGEEQKRRERAEGTGKGLAGTRGAAGVKAGVTTELEKSWIRDVGKGVDTPSVVDGAGSGGMPLPPEHLRNRLCDKTSVAQPHWKRG